jgi:hypothetical protein
VKPGSTPRRLVHQKKTWRDSLPIDVLISAVFVSAVTQPSSEISEGLMNHPVYKENSKAERNFILSILSVSQPE